MSLDEAIRDQIDSLVQSNDVMLFMKGNPQAPQCGFSATVIGILDTLTTNYATADVLADAALRDGIKIYSSWPTIPQLYVKGEFIGGCDIIQELFGTAELHEKLGIEIDPRVQPTLTITESAAAALRGALERARESDGGAGELHLGINAHFQAELALAPRLVNDIEVEAAGIKLLLDPLSAGRANGVEIDAVETGQGTGFKIDNPNAPKPQEG
jgi:monothiol glutaredoxin